MRKSAKNERWMTDKNKEGPLCRWIPVRFYWLFWTFYNLEQNYQNLLGGLPQSYSLLSYFLYPSTPYLISLYRKAVLFIYLPTLFSGFLTNYLTTTVVSSHFTLKNKDAFRNTEKQTVIPDSLVRSVDWSKTFWIGQKLLFFVLIN